MASESERPAAPVFTSTVLARQRWEREGWPEPRDAEQLRLYVLFWTGHEPGVSKPWTNWTRPEQWVEDLVRS